MKILGVLAGAALLLGAQSASALSITNGSFEDPSVAGGFGTLNAGDPSLTGWTIGGNSIDHIGNYWNAQSGSQSVDLNGNNTGSISQLISGLTDGQQYTVSFYAAATPTYGAQGLLVSAGGSSKLLSLADTGSRGNMSWALQTITFIADVTGTALLTFAGVNAGPAGAALDNVTIAATPIPGAILLFGSALGGMGFLGYRRKKLQAAA
jgi:choice-of-anchor C domain-containing protein